MSTPAADATLVTPTPAPLRVTVPGGRLAVVTTPPDLAAANPLADPAFAAAMPLSGLFAAGKPEPADQATRLRLIRCGEMLYLAAECLSPQPPQPSTDADPTELWRGDALEIFFAGSPAPAATADGNNPYTQLVIGADGRCAAWRFTATRRGVDPSATDGLPTAGLTIRTGAGPGGNGWWLCAAIPIDPFVPDLTHLRANFMRDHAGGKASYTWCDMNGGSAHQPERFAPLPLVPAILPANAILAVPALQLPATLAVGCNRLTVVNPAAGFRLQCGKISVPLDQPQVELPLTESGITHLTVQRTDTTARQFTTSYRRYEACVRRPFFIEAATAFADDLTAPIACRLALNIATDKPLPVTLEARQNGKIIGTLQLEADAGLQTVRIPIADAQPGEITLTARAALPVGGDQTLALTAEHLCIRGQTADVYNVFRDGFDQADLQSRYRALFADAAGWLRLIQAGDGRVRTLSRRGSLNFSEWSYGGAYIFAVAYTAEWPENPHRGDKRFLTAALQALEAGIDPEAAMPAGGHSRHLRPLTLTYGLIEKDLDPVTRAHCKKLLTEMVAETVRTRLIPATRRYTMYSEDLGTGTNHFAYYCSGVLAAGRVLNRPDWTALATQFLTRLADHGRDGQFAERPGVSASHYTWLTMHALGQFYEDTKNPDLLPTLNNCAAYSVHTTLPIQGPYLLHDGRNNEYGASAAGAFVLSLTPEGRSLVARLQAELTRDGRRPGHASPEFWNRAADDAMYCRTGATAALPDPTEFTFLGGRGLVARRNGFAYGLSTIPLPPIDGNFRLDPQNQVELHSLGLGPILHGANSQHQPKAGTLMRTVDGRTEYMPVEGTIAKLPDGHAALLEFPSFKARVAVKVRNARQAQVSVQILSRIGAEPVTFNFFPGVRQAEDLTVAADGKTLTFGQLKITCCAAPTIDRNFRLFNPYTRKYTTAVKPVRCHVELTDNATYTLDIEQIE